MKKVLDCTRQGLAKAMGLPRLDALHQNITGDGRDPGGCGERRREDLPATTRTPSSRKSSKEKPRRSKDKPRRSKGFRANCGSSSLSTKVKAAAIELMPCRLVLIQKFPTLRTLVATRGALCSTAGRRQPACALFFLFYLASEGSFGRGCSTAARLCLPCAIYHCNLKKKFDSRHMLAESTSKINIPSIK